MEEPALLKLNSVADQFEVCDDLAHLFPFQSEIIQPPGKTRGMNTREMRRQLNRAHSACKNPMLREQLIRAQQTDETIQRWIERTQPAFKKKIANVWC